jgi:hypothetical protein
MWLDDSVGIAQPYSETHARNHDTSCLKHLDYMGGILGDSGAILSESSRHGQHDIGLQAPLLLVFRKWSFEER